MLCYIFCMLFVTTVHACTQSSWSTWINDRKASNYPLPGEENVADKISIPGGDKENMNATARDRFCAPGRGAIVDIQCVTVVNQTNYIDAQTGSHAMSCEVANGFTCFNRHVDGHACLDYKIRLFCNCTSPLKTTMHNNTASIFGKVTKAQTNATPMTHVKGEENNHPGSSVVTSHPQVKNTERPGGVNAPAVQMSTEKNAGDGLKILPAFFLLVLITAYL